MVNYLLIFLLKQLKNTTKVFNEDTLNALGLDKNHPVFKDAVKIED